MARQDYQVIRQGAETWTVMRVSKLFSATYEYEVVGRVIRDGDWYYVELAEWGDSSYTWSRQPRAYGIPRGALKAITSPPPKRRLD